MDFLGKKYDEPSMAENWLERTERMLQQMHCTPKENLECATSLLRDEAYQWLVSMTRTAIGECYMGVLPGGIQEAICGLYLSEQYETRVS